MAFVILLLAFIASIDTLYQPQVVITDKTLPLQAQDRPHLKVPATTQRPTLRDVLVHDPYSHLTGANTPGLSDSDSAVTLHLSIVTGLFPAFSVDVTTYFAPRTDQGLYNGLKAAIDSDQHHVISTSWGTPEYWVSASPFNNFVHDEDGNFVPLMAALKELLRRASKRGISVFAPAGDGGASAGMATPLNVLFPASAPYAIACGGTSMDLVDDLYTNPVEVVWNATGGGYSQFFRPASFQKAALRGTPNKGRSYRGLPDVAGVADPETGFIVYWTAPNSTLDLWILGGTSAATAVWASLWATVTEGSVRCARGKECLLS